VEMTDASTRRRYVVAEFPRPRALPWPTMPPGLIYFVVWSVLAAMPITGIAAPDESPPLNLVAANVRALPYTAHVQIIAAVPAGEIRDSSSHKPGYVNFRVSAKVIETIKGARLPKIEYFETHEAPSAGPRAGSHVVISLQRNPDGSLFVPDNGYVFPFSEGVLKQARRAAHRPTP